MTHCTCVPRKKSFHWEGKVEQVDNQKWLIRLSEDRARRKQHFFSRIHFPRDLKDLVIHAKAICQSLQTGFDDTLIRARAYTRRAYNLLTVLALKKTKKTGETLLWDTINRCFRESQTSSSTERNADRSGLHCGPIVQVLCRDGRDGKPLEVAGCKDISELQCPCFRYNIVDDSVSQFQIVTVGRMSRLIHGCLCFHYRVFQKTPLHARRHAIFFYQ